MDTFILTSETRLEGEQDLEGPTRLARYEACGLVNFEGEVVGSKRTVNDHIDVTRLHLLELDFFVAGYLQSHILGS